MNQRRQVTENAWKKPENRRPPAILCRVGGRRKRRDDVCSVCGAMLSSTMRMTDVCRTRDASVACNRQKPTALSSGLQFIVRIVLLLALHSRNIELYRTMNPANGDLDQTVTGTFPSGAPAADPTRSPTGVLRSSFADGVATARDVEGRILE